MAVVVGLPTWDRVPDCGSVGGGWLGGAERGEVLEPGADVTGVDGVGVGWEGGLRGYG